MSGFHLAQVNIGRFRAPIDDPIMEGFRTQLDPVNALRHVEQHGPTPYAFTFRSPFPAPDMEEAVDDGSDAVFCDWAPPDAPPG